MQNFIPYSELKSKINLMEVAADLGYKLDIKQGRKFPVMVKTDGMGRKIDSIVICNPGNNDRMGYFRHAGGKGDVISLIRENQNELARHGNSVYRILLHYAGAENVSKVENRSLWEDEKYKSKPFSLDNYSIETLKEREYVMQKLFQSRALSLETARVFSANLLKVSHWQPSKKDGQDRWMATNLGFPYRVPGNDEIVGLELRGFNFKSKTAGSNSSDAVWSIDFTNGKPQDVTAVFFAESPYDLMAMYQLRQNSINLSTSAFVATGGAFSKNQILNAMRHYSNAKAYDCFDNDLPGRVYGIRMMMLLEGREFAAIPSGKNYKFTVDNKQEFSIPKDMVTMQEFRKHVNTRYVVGLMKAPKEYKDWNDVTMGKRIDGKMTVENGLARHLDDNYNKRMDQFRNKR
ncbi:MAG: toprim domain-containing protein [Bacteroidales bacterium]|nr:toprim domain-containing protein [Bacteroidales bacterium]